MDRYWIDGDWVVDNVAQERTYCAGAAMATEVAAALNEGSVDPADFVWERIPPRAAPASGAGTVGPLTRMKRAKRPWRRLWPWAAVAAAGVLVGAGIGAAGAAPTSEPAPTRTVTVEVPVGVEVEGPVEACQRIAVEYRDLLLVANERIMVPQNEITQTLIDNLMNGTDVASIEAATEKLTGVTGAANEIAERVSASAADYTECVG